MLYPLAQFDDDLSEQRFSATMRKQFQYGNESVGQSGRVGMKNRALKMTKIWKSEGQR